METVSSFPSRYKQAANEFQKSARRRERATSLSQIFQTMHVTDWVGTIVEMKTNSDGLGILFVSLPSITRIRLETWNNGFSDNGFDTMIPQSSPLYAKVAGYAKGTSIVFSGNFWPQGLDYIHEISLTEEGSMTDPEYLFTFSKLESTAEFQKENQHPDLAVSSNDKPASVPNDAIAPDSQPVVLSKVEPESSETARLAQFAGTVSASVRVDVNGKVVRAMLINPPGLDLDDKIQRALLQWKFKPAMKDGVPISADTTVTVTIQ